MSPLRRLLVSHALAAVAMSLPWPLLLLLVSERVAGDQRGDLLLGLTAAARMLPYVALSWATGALADRFRRDRIVRATLVSRVALLLVLAGALAQGWLLLAVLAASAAVGCGTPAYPALAAAMPALAGDGRRRATDLLVTIEVASFVVGPALGGLLLVRGAESVVAAVAVLATVLALLLVHGVVLPVPVPASGVDAPRGGSALGTVRRTPGVARAIATVALLNGVLAALGLTLLPLATAEWGQGGAGFGLATGVLGFGALAAPLLWWCGRTSRTRTRSGLLLLAASLALVPLAPQVGWAVPALALAGAAAVHVEGAVTEQIQDAVPDTVRAGALGLTDSAMVGAALFGSIAAPLLVALVGPRQLLVLLAGACAGVVVVTGRRAATAQPVPVLAAVTRPVLSRLPEQRSPARRPARSSSAGAPRG